MAKAPKPKKGGHEAAKDRVEAVKKVFHVTAKGSDLDFHVAPNNLTLQTRRRVRRETGQSVELLLWDGGAGIDSYAYLWWVARLDGGEDISFLKFQKEWDKDYRHVTLDDISAPLVEDGDSPES